MIIYKIPPQNFEVIRDAIGAILTIEFDNQAANFYNTDCEDVDVFVEENDPMNHVKLPIISICTSLGKYDNRHAGYVDGLYTYEIWVYTNSKTNKDNTGAKLSAVKMQRLVGICRAILEDPIYKTLGFVAGGIGNVKVTGFEVGTIKRTEEDALSTAAGKLTLEVKAQETSKLLPGSILTEALTKIKLELTEYGYQYKFI